jgi:hypothetical protein
MKNLQDEAAVREAVCFLLSRVAEQARADSVPLTDAELKQLSFGEETASPDEIAAVAAFDEGHDEAEFETRIAKLLKRAFRIDVQHGSGATWHKALAELRDHDVYILVMVDQAGISRPQPKVGAALFAPSYRGLARLLPFAVASIISALGVLYFFILPMSWGKGADQPRIFGNLGEKLIPDERVRGIFFVVWIACSLWLWRLTNKQK